MSDEYRAGLVAGLSIAGASFMVIGLLAKLTEWLS